MNGCLACGKKLFVFNEYFPLQLDEGNILLTTRHGGWVVLSGEEYGLLKQRDFDENDNLFSRLENAGIILTTDSFKKAVSETRKKNGFLFSNPSYHVIDVTNNCNLNCLYCFANAGPGKKDMNKETADKTLDFIFSIPNRRCRIVVEGGEPLLNWKIMKYICQEAKKRAEEKKYLSFQISFMTNLTMMTDEIAEELKSMGIVGGTSFDGPKEIHDKQRPFRDGTGSYDSVVYWHERLKKKYGLHFGLLPLVTGITLGYGPKAMVDEFLKRGENMVFFKHFRPNGRGLKNFSELEMKPEEFFKFWKEGIEYCLSLNKKGKKIRERGATHMLSNILNTGYESMCYRRPCGAGGFPMLSYGTDGSIFACDSLRSVDFFNLGNVATDTYQTVRLKALPILALAPDFIPGCSSCPFMAYCGICPGGAAGQENDLYPKIPRSFQCKWQKEAFKYLFSKLAKEDEDAIILKSWANSPCEQKKPLCQV